MSVKGNFRTHLKCNVRFPFVFLILRIFTLDVLVQRLDVGTDSELPLARTVLDIFSTDGIFPSNVFAREPCSNYICVSTMKRLNCTEMPSWPTDEMDGEILVLLQPEHLYLP